MKRSPPIGPLALILCLGYLSPAAVAQTTLFPQTPNPGTSPGGLNLRSILNGAIFGNNTPAPSAPYVGGTYPQPGSYSSGYGVTSPPPGNTYGGGNYPNPGYQVPAGNPYGGGPYPNPGYQNPTGNPYGGGAYPNPGYQNPTGNPYGGAYPNPGYQNPAANPYGGAPYPNPGYQNPNVNPYVTDGTPGYQSNYVPPGTPAPGGLLTAPAPGLNANPVASTVARLADQLVQQAEGFLQAFAPTANVVPEGQQFLAEATAVRDAAARLRQVAASGGNPVNEFNNVATLYQALEARMARVSHGRIGPNIRNALQMGTIIQQIRGSFP